MQQTTSCQAYLDWLRIMAIIGVLFFHSAMPYVAEWSWHIKNKETSYLLMEFNFWLSRFRMPLLFFISGTVTYFMMQRRSGGSFIMLRLRRLLIPLLIGIFIIVPPQIYMERLTQGFKGNYLNFYATVYNFVPYPNGNTSWHHLWFIAYLFIYDVAFAFIFKWFMNNKHKLTIFSNLAKGKRVYILMLPSVIMYALLEMHYPETNDLIHDGFYFYYWLFFLLAGFICINFPALMDSLERNRQTSLTFAVITIITINYLRWNKLEPQNVFADYQHNLLIYLYIALYAMTAWLWVFTAVGYGKRYLNKQHPVLHYVNQAVYPFYILHQTIIVVLVYYVVQTNDTILMKYLFTVVVAFLVTMSIFHVLVRPFEIMRFLFGMKPNKEVMKINAQERITTKELAVV